MMDYSAMDQRALFAVPIRYGGSIFRSILEARWAVFFDCIGAKWKYEPESFAINDRYTYTPDFCLTNVSLRRYEGMGVFIEIKPRYAEIEKRGSFYMAFPTSLIAFAGNPPGGGIDYEFGGTEWGQAGWDNYMVFMKCPRCSRIKIEYGAASSYRECPVCKSDVVPSDNFDRIIRFPFSAAKDAALNARVIQANPIPFLQLRLVDRFLA